MDVKKQNYAQQYKIKNSEECLKHPVYEDGKKKDDYICVSNPEGGCIGVRNIMCPKTEKLEEDEKCSYFKASNNQKVCVENTDEEYSCKEEFLCESADSGETDDECMNYIVSNSTKFICLKNPEKTGSFCKEIELCSAV